MTIRMRVAGALLLAAGLAVPYAAASRAGVVVKHIDAAEPIIGLWSYRASFPTGLSGELRILLKGGHWHATLGRATAQAPVNGRVVRIVFPGDGGTFRGIFEGGVLRGFWSRRQVVEDPLFPFGQSLGYTGPLQIQQHGPGRWTAAVRPLEDTFTLYLKVYREEGGALKAAFRNPEQNSIGPAMLLNASRAGNAVRFVTDVQPGKAAEAINATLLYRPDRLALVWPDWKRRIELRRINPEAATHFLPRPASEQPYVYRTPGDRGDGWTVARAADVGMDEAALAKAVQRIIDRGPAKDRAWLIHSMAVAYKGKLVLDEYFYGWDPDQPHDMRSASKTFSSVILGALMREGVPITPATKLYETMTPLGPFANPDPRKARITLGHLLTP